MKLTIEGSKHLEGPDDFSRISRISGGYSQTSLQIRPFSPVICDKSRILSAKSGTRSRDVFKTLHY